MKKTAVATPSSLKPGSFSGITVYSLAMFYVWRIHLTLAEIVTANREYTLEYRESGSHSALTEEYVAWCLLKLYEVGMAAAVIETESAHIALH